MIETVKTLGLQEIPYRGHRDSGPLDLSSHPGPNKKVILKLFLDIGHWVTNNFMKIFKMLQRI